MTPDAGEVVAAALRDLPWWVRGGPWLLAGPYVFLVLLVLSRLGLLATGGPLRRLAPDAHWTERARALWPMRVSVGYALVATLLWSVLYGAWRANGWAARAGAPLVLLLVVAVILGIKAGGAPLARAVRGPRLRLLERIRGTLAWLLLMYPHLLVALGLALWLPATPVAMGLATAGLVAVVIALMAGSTAILAAWLGFVDAADPAGDDAEARLHRIVATAAGRLGRPPPRAYLVSRAAVNAAAYPLGNVVLYTRAALEVLSDEHLIAVALHELAHLDEPNGVRIQRVVRAAAGTLAITHAFPLLRAGELVAGLSTVLVGLVVTLIAGRVARRMEVRADAAGRHHEGDPGVYAAALERIYEENRVPAVLGSPRRAHPDLYDRLVAVGVTPAWPRPAAPPLLAARVTGVFDFLAVFFAIFVVPSLLVTWAATIGDERLALEMRLASGVRRVGVFEHLAVMAAATHDNEAVGRAIAAAMALEPANPRPPAVYATILAGQGDCLGAARALRVASAIEAEATREGIPGESSDDTVVEVPALGDAAEAIATCFGAMPGEGTPSQGNR